MNIKKVADEPVLLVLIHDIDRRGIQNRPFEWCSKNFLFLYPSRYNFEPKIRIWLFFTKWHEALTKIHKAFNHNLKILFILCESLYYPLITFVEFNSIAESRMNS